MIEGEHILISLESRHAENIFAGKKKLELRRRSMNVAIGTTIWIYVKLPVGSVMGKARVSAVHSLAPSTLWRRFAAISGLTHKEFFDYFAGISKGFAISLEDTERFRQSISLQTLRKVPSGFQPPQFFMRLDAGKDLLKVLAESQSVCAASVDGVDDVREFRGNNNLSGDEKKSPRLERRSASNLLRDAHHD